MYTLYSLAVEHHRVHWYFSFLFYTSCWSLGLIKTFIDKKWVWNELALFLVLGMGGWVMFIEELLKIKPSLISLAIIPITAICIVSCDRFSSLKDAQSYILSSPKRKILTSICLLWVIDMFIIEIPKIWPYLVKCLKIDLILLREFLEKLLYHI